MANLAPTQVEQLQRIGAHLRTVRQEQGLSLDILANQIFIRPALLQALETGREEQLPEAVFIQGFIRRYAEALGLDGKAIAQEFVVSPPPMVPSPDLSAPAESSAPATPVAAAKPTPVPAPTPVSAPAPVPVIKSAPEPAPTSVVQPAPTPAAEPTKAPVAPQPASTPQTAPLANPFPLADSMAEERRGGGFPLWLALVGAVLLIGGGLGLWLGRGSNPQTATPPAEAPAPTETPVPEEPVAAEPEPEPEPEPVALEAPIVVAVRLSEPSWLSVVADGRTVYEGTSDSGYEETWTAQTSLVFITGNAGGVSLSFNGEDPVVLGDSGAVRTLRLTPDSEAAELASP